MLTARKPQAHALPRFIRLMLLVTPLVFALTWWLATRHNTRPDTPGDPPVKLPDTPVAMHPSTLPSGMAGRILELRPSLFIQLAHIRPGTFTMGSPPTERGRGNDEEQHPVTIKRSFYIGLTPITQAQWRDVMGNHPAHFQGDDLPIEQVSWNDAAEFCRRLSRRVHRPVRLPTEAEWEYACRAGATGPFHTGNDLAPTQANFAHDASGAPSTQPSRKATTPVASFPPNAWGLYDMHGNVWQWCSDWYGPYSAGEAIDPEGPTDGASRVLRGGAWDMGAAHCRCARRSMYMPGDRSASVGFRLAMDGE